MRILGIDPGSVICGYGVIDSEGSKLSLVEYGVIKAAKKEETFPLRLTEIFNRLTEVIARSLPDEAAFESMFYSKNVQSLVKLSHARAAAMIAASLREIPVVEYAPRLVKKSVTGNGSASKEQVRYMVKSILSISEEHKFMDATDALSVAICHSIKKGNGNSAASTWEQFIKDNPGRIISS